MADSFEIERPSRWDVPFDSKMNDEIVDSVLTHLPFSAIDQSAFPKHIPFRDILRNDTRVLNYRSGDIIVREGDYGNSAFFIMRGSIRVVISSASEGGLPDSMLGRQEPHQKKWFEAISQLWKNSKVPGYRARVRHQENKQATEVALRKEGENTRIFLQDVPAVLEKFRTVEIKSGEFFGEIAALGRTPRTATAIAAEDDVQLLEIKWQGLRDIRLHAAQIKDHIDKLYRERSLAVHLREAMLFNHLSDEEMAVVVAQTQFKSYGSFDWHGSYKKMAGRSSQEQLNDEPVIAAEGDYPNGLVLIRAGFARLSERSGNGHRTVTYFGRGQHYGFREIVHNWKNQDSVPYEFTLRGVGYVDVLVVPTSIIEKYVLPKLPENLMPWMEYKVSKVKATRHDSDALAKREKERRVGTDVLEFMVENRVMNGTATMLIDMDRCTQCDDCIRACAAAHDDNPRFLREGKQIGRWMVANSCMHCQDPICMIGCPTGAINRNANSGQIVINDLTCIGCSVCAESCPYDNILMETTRNEKNEFIVDTESQRPIVKATKCDLCSDQMGGPACQRACAHDAMVRVDMRDYVGLSKWMSR